MSHPQAPAILIDTDGTITILDNAEYETIRDSVGGCIESIPTDGRIVIIVNETGKIERLPLNRLGHALWEQVDFHQCISNGGDWIAGPCVVTGPPDPDGNTTTVPDWVLPTLATLAVRIGVVKPDRR